MEQPKIYVAGHMGMVGSAIIRCLREKGFENIVTRNRSELDLVSQQSVSDFFAAEKPDLVYLAAAKVGGIHANNSYPAEFIYQNLMIESNIIHAAYQNNTERLLFLGSSCIYPKLAEQPMAESALLTGALEPTNEPYAIAKIAGIKLCESYNRQYNTDFRSVMPTNLYGPGDNYHLENSHVIPALIRKFHDAKENGDDTVTMWGTGKAMREFLHVDDMAAASVFVMNLEKRAYQNNVEPSLSHINVGTGLDITVAELSEMVMKVTGFEGAIIRDTSKPDGAPRKLLDVSRIRSMGWQPDFSIEAGLDDTYRWFRAHVHSIRS